MQFPVDLAIAATARELPEHGHAYEPKLDGWRACSWGGRARLHSRSGTDLTDRFPEIAAAVAELGDVVLDGELVAMRATAPRLDFAALQAGPRRRRNEGVHVSFQVFDLLAQDGQDLRKCPWHERREALLEVLPQNTARVQRVPATTCLHTAREWLDPAYGPVGIEGVVSKPVRAAYRPGRRGGWVKTRHVLTTEALVAGITGTPEHPREAVLARPTRAGRWHAIGLTQPLPAPLRRELAARVPLLGTTATVAGIISGLPGSPDVAYWPAHPSVILEIDTDGIGEYQRLRHRPRARRVRDDLTLDALPLADEPTRSATSEPRGPGEPSTGSQR